MPRENESASHEANGYAAISTSNPRNRDSAPSAASGDDPCFAVVNVLRERSPSLESAILTADESVSTHSKPKTFSAQLVRVKRKGGKGYRTGIRIRSLSLAPETRVTDDISDIADSTSQVAADPPLPPSFRSELVAKFGREAFERIEKFAVGDNTSGVHLPAQLRDLFPALNNANVAIQIVNTARLLSDLPSMPDRRSTRVALRRVIAKMRIRLYTELLSALTLPSAPDAPDSDIDSEQDEKSVITLTPTNLTAMSKALPKAFPQDKADVKAFLSGEMEAAYGEKAGGVVWQSGIGRVLGGHGGFRGKVEDGDIHVFVDQ